MKKGKKGLLVYVLAFALALGLAACAKGGKPTSEAAQGAAASIYPLTVTDASGAEITIEKEPQTIISAAPNITEIIYALGAQDLLVARTDYCDYPQEVSEIKSIGSITTPDIEQIVELNPDLVITSTHFDEKNAANLKAMGITVYHISEQESFEGSYTAIKKVAQVLDREVNAMLIINEMKTEVSMVTALVEGLEAPTVYYVVEFGEYGDYTAGGDTFIGQLIEMAGGINVAADVKGWSYNLESLIEADPDIIIVSELYDTKTEFENTEGYSELKAVKQGHVYEMDTNTLNRQGVRNDKGLKALAQIIHPEVFID